MKFYFIGIKGSAMSALAKILLDLNFYVRGCDVLDDYEFYLDIKDKIICDSFDDIVYDEKYYYIIGNAYTESQVTKEIIKRKYKYEYYPKFINSLFTLDKFAISATHGKTTICKIVSCILEEELSYLIGDGSGAYNKNSLGFLFEACEYKKTFLNYYPEISIVNNIDYDHPDYYVTQEDYFNAFLEFSRQSKLLIYNGDDLNCKRLNHSNKISYGFNEENDIVCNYVNTDVGYKVFIKSKECTHEFSLPFYGKHMIYNFLAAFCLCKKLNISDEQIQSKINTFVFPKRRNQTTVLNDKTLICDYAHHPNEIKAFYEGVSLKYKTQKKVVVFQSHTNSRSMTFKKEFKESLSLFDEIYYVDIFSSAREKTMENINEDFFRYLNFPKYTSVIENNLLKEKDIVLCFVGAGSVDELYKDFIESFYEKFS